ncbi:alpha-L-fucosidase [Aeoliella mucimassa]|uniref:alpha-L-fucosidase n=1 Tax=Aeoliella mucimassa TaxID=2527972 RepID=A0A518AVP5_9BACT|nr:alpha-L-fucosidase [Aeoliella mucimassa]QDU58782.1 Alpha-L-fucosidase [Aeoliella mucimassa]
MFTPFESEAMKRTLTLCLLLSCLLVTATKSAMAAEPAAPAAAEQVEPMTTPEREQRMEWWRDARFGMFVHWGLYSGLAGTWEGKPVGERGGMEWIQYRVRADTDTYAERALPLSKPTENFAEQWAKLAKQAGCKYLVFTTKHHDGFALHDSAVSDFDAGSKLDRDLVKEIVDACRAEGLRVGFYHSVIDWHHDQYEYEKSNQLPHPLKGKPYPNGERDHAKYQEYLHAQVKELTTNYGPVDILWWDYSATDFQGEEAWRAFELMDLVRNKQPQVIMNNRLFRIPEAGWTSMQMTGVAAQLNPKYGDFVTPEQHVPDRGLPGVDWETCMTMNTTWGYSRHDQAWKPNDQLVHTLIDIASKGGNFLLNIGPTGDGTVPPESIEGMQAIGKWMETNSESIYGTTASPCDAPAWGRITTKGDTLYLHVFDWPESGELTVPVEATAEECTLLADAATKFAVSSSDAGLTVKLTGEAVDPYATVLKLKLTEPIESK